MENVTVDKSKLIEIVDENKKEHQEKFSEAWDSWRAKMIQNYERIIDSLKDRKKAQTVQVNVNLTRPEDHTSEYDRALQMLQMHLGESIELDEQTFAELVQNEWGWERQFAAAYLSNTGKRYGKFGM